MIFLKVPFKEKEKAKRLGAKWDPVAKAWYLPEGVNPNSFSQWLPEHVAKVAVADVSVSDNLAVNDNKVVAGSGLIVDKQEYTLCAYLYKVSDIIVHSLPAFEWISCEISEFRINRGHAYLTLVEHDDNATLLARTNARIWQNKVGTICERFTQGTGSNLDAGLKVLIKVQPSFHPNYGFSLVIEDIDPAYTLGDMAAKLASIRQELLKLQVIDNNRKLAKPVDFFNVAVISPKNAAGLGDFMREAQILQQHALCDFAYFVAKFQGEGTPLEIMEALEAAVLQHAIKNFDAIVIIRGGGAAADLAWLNDLELAKAVCNLGIPVMVGIGHERDSTILDEIACMRFDTPSKVSARIFNVITNNAMQAHEAMQSIIQAAYDLQAQLCLNLDSMFNSIQDLTKQNLNLLLIQMQNSLQLIESNVALQVQNVNLNLDTWQQNVEYYARAFLQQVTLQLQQTMEQILVQDPKFILQKGFAIIKNPKGDIITSSKMLGAQFSVTWHDGTVQAQLEQIHD